MILAVLGVLSHQKHFAGHPMGSFSLGVDPGLFGALAVYDPQTCVIVKAHNIPILSIKRNRKNKNTVDIPRLVNIVGDLSRQFAMLRAFHELVGPMSKQGVSSTWSFSRAATASETAIIAAQIPYTLVSPQKWKKALACPADKDGALLRAGQLIPGSIAEWSPVRGFRTKEECKGIAEAALIALYGSRFDVATPLAA